MSTQKSISAVTTRSSAALPTPPPMAGTTLSGMGYRYDGYPLWMMV